MATPKELPRGMKLRGGTYYAWFKSKGKFVSKRLSTNLRTAEKLLLQLRARYDLMAGGMSDNSIDIADVEKSYLAYIKQTLKPASVQRSKHCLSLVIPGLGAKRVSEVAQAAVIAYREQRLGAGLSPRTVNLEVQSFMTMLRWAKRNRMIASLPVEELKPLPHDNPKDGRPLTPAEVEKLLAVSSQPWRDIWYAFVVTGMRKNELATLRWRDIDWEAREIIVRSSVAKNRTVKRIPIENGLWDILIQRRGEKREPGRGKTLKITRIVEERFTQEHVFTTSENTPLSNPKAIYYAFMRSCKKAGIATLSFDENGDEIDHIDVHSLRRTFATTLIINGADPKTVQELMGHKTLAMTMNLYAKINIGTKRSAVASLPYGKGAQSPPHVVATISLKDAKAVDKEYASDRKRTAKSS